jgi:hypothetical protein
LTRCISCAFLIFLLFVAIATLIILLFVAIAKS